MKPSTLASKKKRQQRTESNLRTHALEFRKRFVTEYLKDFRGIDAYYRAGGTAKNRESAASQASGLLTEPFVCKSISDAIDEAKEAHLITRNRVIAGLVREANLYSLNASHGARVSAYKVLGDILGMATKKVEGSLTVKGGVLLIPMTDPLETWEQRAAAAQAALKEAVRS